VYQRIDGQVVSGEYTDWLGDASLRQWSKNKTEVKLPNQDKLKEKEEGIVPRKHHVWYLPRPMA
jgi:hypothetical protein